MKVSVKAPAKINLALDVLGKRPDGYHEVHMVMTTIDLADRIELMDLGEDRITLVTDYRFVPDDNRNFAYQAARLLKEKFHITRGVQITIDKCIPVAAGLAGGSSDAAATLRGLNKLWNLQLSTQELAELGSEIGSDVAFCVYGGTAIASGRGEKVEPISSPPPCWVVLAKPNIGVSTAEVYGKVQMETIQHANVREMVQAIEKQDYEGICEHLSNSLEAITMELHPEVEQIKEQMRRFGADGVLMSGSGPTVFALTKYESRMQRIYNGLRGFCDQVYAVRLLSESPLE
ncbi:4-(cytidine 5'-diphospho)-2-C-methyl-D-erythritol kinase [Massilibacterium senegalense]|uniref:4-(cytidine 5'-diphospho)-2-C-methyl-D-erythritol kinase n=1 Tax=Massilibacterium senegalense TaxID=1632858 RepID=UPI000781B2A5|nr:4-(cytidine 5'-diphospho)-2-C-methyl-D-erythritol kinase [Massilibacterium senegalense]